MYDNKRLFLVFEYLELDLKKFMDTTPTLCHNRELIKVQSIPQSHSINPPDGNFCCPYQPHRFDA